MNLLHRWICRSGYWRHTVEREMPWCLDDLGPRVKALEIGPGFGVTTDLLRTRVASLTCVEPDEDLAYSLPRRVNADNIAVVRADASRMPLASGQFGAAFCFTMLHHVPSLVLQDLLLREVARVLSPGGTFAGMDSLSSPVLRLIHTGDTFVPADPATFPARLQTAGFADIRIDVTNRRLRFRARRG